MIPLALVDARSEQASDDRFGLRLAYSVLAASVIVVSINAWLGGDRLFLDKFSTVVTIGVFAAVVGWLHAMRQEMHGQRQGKGPYFAISVLLLLNLGALYINGLATT